MAELTPGQKLRQVLGIGVMADNRHGADRPRLQPALVIVVVAVIVIVGSVIVGRLRP